MDQREGITDHKMSLSCELPHHMMGYNGEFNDFDFVLYHLYEKHKWYRDYYRDMRKNSPKRLMIFDNSAYEFYVKGETLDLNKFHKAINKLKPDFYILPDVLMDRKKTMELAKEFLDRYSKDTVGVPMGVIQGNTCEELLESAKDMIKLGVTSIAIPFHNRFFHDLDVPEYIRIYFAPRVFGELNEDQRYAAGRVYWVRTWLGEVIKDLDYIHMLGTHSWVEKAFYNDMKIDSMDTSYPIKCAMCGYELGKEPHKPDIIIDDILEDPITTETKDLIIKNMEIFNQYNNDHFLTKLQ